MIKRPRKRRALISSIKRLRARRFGALELRRLPDRGALGDISVLHERLAPRTRLPLVRHLRTAELVYCVSGSMTALVGRRRWTVRAGGVILIPPGVGHAFMTGADPCDCLSVFSPALDIAPGADIHVAT